MEVYVPSATGAQPLDNVTQNNWKVALVMPFNFQLTKDNPEHSKARLSEVCLNYYQGLVLAMDTLAQAGIPVTLKVYDSQGSSEKLGSIIQQMSEDKPDFIIGPIFKAGLQQVGTFAQTANIKHLSPLLTMEQDTLADSCLFSAYPDLSYYGVFLANYIQYNYPKANVIVVRDGSSTDKVMTPKFLSRLSSVAGIQVKTMNYSSNIKIESQLLKDSTPNLVFIPSRIEYNINRSLLSIKDTTIDVRVFGLDSWMDFKNIEFKIWNRSKVSMLSPYYINYSDTAVTNFRNKYREKYLSEPNEYVFKGYDHLLFFMQAYETFGQDFWSYIDKRKIEAFHTNFYFTYGESGWMNQYLHILSFEDYQLLKLNKY